MNLAAKIKKAPRWAWWTVGGVTIGAVAIRMYKSKTTASADTPAANPADMAYSGYSAGYTTPIISGATDTSSGVGGTDWQSGVQGLFDAYDQFFANMQAQEQTTIDALTAIIANGGSPPQSTAANPTPNGTSTPTAQPTAPTAQPTATGSSSQPTTAQETCASKYPSYPQHNPANGAPSAKSCFKDGCHSHRKAHVYKNGDFVIMGGDC